MNAPFASKAILTDEPRSWEEIIAEREAVRASMPATREEYLDQARIRQSGRGFSTPFLSVSDEELAQADTHIATLLNRDYRVQQQDEFFALYGVRRGDDLRIDPVTVEVSQGNPELVARLLDTSRDISPSEWSVIEGGLK